jgi:hypothetical protein
MKTFRRIYQPAAAAQSFLRAGRHNVAVSPVVLIALPRQMCEKGQTI